MSPIGMINVIIVFVVTVIVSIIVFLYDSKNIQSVSNMMTQYDSNQEFSESELNPKIYGANLSTAY